MGKNKVGLQPKNCSWNIKVIRYDIKHIWKIRFFQNNCDHGKKFGRTATRILSIEIKVTPYNTNYQNYSEKHVL